MHPTGTSQLQELLWQKKTAINLLDEDLMKQLAKQKLLAELLQDMEGSSLSQSRSEFTVSENSMMSSNCSGISFDSDYVNQQIQKVKDYMKKVQETGQYPQIPEFMDPKQILLQKKRRLRLSSQVKPVARKKESLSKIPKKNIKKEMLKQPNYSQQPSLELKQLQEQQIKAHLMHQQTILKQHKRHEQLYQLVTLKQALRSQNLKEQRQRIRRQLLQQQRNKKADFLSNQQPIVFKKRLNQISQQQLFNGTVLKAQRSIQFRGILKACSRANRKAEVLRQKIRNYSFY